MTVRPADPPTAPVVFDAPFSDRNAWAVGRTSAYPSDGRNPGDNKLDWIGPDYGPTADGVFTARPAQGGLWRTDLVSTEYAPGGFELLPGDELSATCTVQAQRGAWPALWTWGRDGAAGGPQPGHGEVDFFEYHDGNPTMLELSNHVGGAGHDADGVVEPGRPFTLHVVLGADSVQWQVDGTTVYSDHRGVGAGWRAWLVVNISVAAGAHGHQSPRPGTRELSWHCEGLEVRRPAAHGAPRSSGRA
jgi:hypothetical protein